jgi:hypothetical protein
MSQRWRLLTVLLMASWACAAATHASAQVTAKNCVKKSISGTVTKGQLFRAQISATLEFRLNPEVTEGWKIEVGPPDVDFVGMVSPPYHFNTTVAIATEYGQTARQAVARTSREMSFVLNRVEFARAERASNEMMYGQREDHVEEGSRLMDRIRVGSLRVTILDSKVEDEPAPGTIEWIRFRADACLPK